MPINRAAINLAVKLLGRRHAKVVLAAAYKQDRIENRWVARTEALNEKLLEGIIDGLKANGRARIPQKIIYEFLFGHYLDVATNAIDSAEAEVEVIDARLARPRVPRSLAEIRKAYDVFRRTGRTPKGFKDMGDKIKDEYLKKVSSVWKTYSGDFREGDSFTQDGVLRKVKEAAGTAESRAKTIVRTETTNYYNRTRREIYDQTDAVTHYLFLAIRDQRTSKWCTDRVVDGKRGRHGLVYKKSDPITAQETPACHWNCRSEMVPLVEWNPRHRKLIEDEALQRRRNKCHPLPKGWGDVS